MEDAKGGGWRRERRINERRERGLKEEGEEERWRKWEEKKAE